MSEFPSSLFAVSTVSTKSVLISQSVDVPENVSLTLKGRTVIVKRPRGTLWTDFNHISVELSLFGQEKKRLCVDKRDTPGTISSHGQGCWPGLPSQEEVCVCPLPRQRYCPGEWVSC